MISLDGYRRRWEERKVYASTADWLKSVYSRWLRRVRLPMPGRGRICSISLRSVPHPFYFRLGSTDLLVLEEIFMRGEYDMVRTGISVPPRVIVDLGANVGYSVRLWLEWYPLATVVAVEPESRNAAVFRMNCESIGKSQQVHFFEACVRSFNGESYFESTGAEWAYSATDCPGTGNSRVQTYTLDRVLELAGVNGTIDLLKCDIEGGEQELFRESGKWLRRTGSLVVEVHPPYTLAALGEDLRRAGTPRPLLHENKTSMVAFFGSPL